MKYLKRILVCILSLTILYNSPLAHVSAAVESETLSTSETIVVKSEKGDVSVLFYFTYSDGNSADLIAVICQNSNYDILNPPSTSWNEYSRVATVVVTHKTTGAQVTLGAWCDIYGQTGTF